MKRSQINSIMRSADEFIRRHGFRLPPFAYWMPDQWRTKGLECAEIEEDEPPLRLLSADYARYYKG